MDIDKVSRTYDTLVSHMKANGLGRVACNSIAPMVRRMVEHKGEFSSYPDFFSKFIDKEGINGKTKRLVYYRSAVRHIWAFDEYNHYPDRMIFLPILGNRVNPYEKLCENFKTLIDEYITIAKAKLLMSKSIKVDVNIASKFFMQMQEMGAYGILDIKPNMVISHFIRNGEYIRGNDISSKLKKVLRNFICKYPELKEIIKYIPSRRDFVRLHDIIPDQEIYNVKEALQNTLYKYNLRDKAMVALAVYTGMRGTDIAKLTIDDIDWSNDRIKIVQSKTQQTLTLPMVPALGNILYEYIVKEWPNKKGKRNLFFNMINNNIQANGANVSDAVHKFFLRLGFGLDGKQRRLHTVRHYLASKLLTQGVEPAVISSILGHTDPESLNHYLDMDIENLRKCALDISIFPINYDIFK